MPTKHHAVWLLWPCITPNQAAQQSNEAFESQEIMRMVVRREIGLSESAAAPAPPEMPNFYGLKSKAK